MAGFFIDINLNKKMNNIFDVEEGKVVLKASSLSIPEFKKIWDSDKTKEKKEAYNKLSFITFFCNNSLDNPYRGYSEDDRLKVLKKDYLGSEDVDLTKDILIAIDKYRETQDTVATRLLRSAKKAADKLSEYFDEVDFSKVDKLGKPIYSSRDLASNLKEIGNIVKSLSALEDQVRKEQSTSGKIRGGGEIGDYEIPDKNFKYDFDDADR